jgi:hypothetical protein
MTKIFYIIFFNLAILHSNVLQIDKGNELPSSEGDIERFTPEQDSAYKKALNSRLPTEILLKETLDFIEINILNAFWFLTIIIF